MVTIYKSRLDYQAYYCEENVWRLLAGAALGTVSAWAVIVSNAAHNVVILRQSTGRPVDGLVHWDYHVFAVVSDPQLGKIAIDMDSDLPFPCPLPRYLQESFPGDAQKCARPRFRVLRSRDYVDGFVSDRSHMRRKDGSWLAPPPPWPAPGEGSGRPNVLKSWLDMGRRLPGIVYDPAGMAAFAAAH